MLPVTTIKIHTLCRGPHSAKRECLEPKEICCCTSAHQKRRQAYTNLHNKLPFLRENWGIQTQGSTAPLRSDGIPPVICILAAGRSTAVSAAVVERHHQPSHAPSLPILLVNIPIRHMPCWRMKMRCASPTHAQQLVQPTGICR